MTVTFSGSNIFGQWGSPADIVEEFQTYDLKPNSSFDFKNAKLLHVSWSHNIFEKGGSVFITGDIESSGQPFQKLNLPPECVLNANIRVISNEHYILIINEETCSFWSIGLENKSQVRKIKLNTEVPIEDNVKRSKLDDSIVKCVVCDESILFLTNQGLVYSGLLPSLVDTSHCIGKVVDVQCGFEHYIAVTDTGAVYTWGNGRRLQLGHGDVNILETPTLLEALAGIKIIKVAAGGWHSLALSESGDLYAWGWNDFGQLGVIENSTDCFILLPKLVDLFDGDGNEVNQNVKDIACGSRHSAILLDNNTVWTSGCNKYGQLGFPRKDKVEQFRLAFQHSNVNKILCGPWATVIIT